MTTTNELHVIFGSGPLGKWTARELLSFGHRVRIINRSGKVTGVPSNVEVLKGDAYDIDLNVQQTQGATSVYQCAQPEYYEWAAKFPQLQAAVLEAASRNHAKFIAAENVYMYGDTHGQPMTETTPYEAHTRKGRVRQAMTEAIFAAHAAGKVRAATVRGSDFFGPDDPIYTENIFVPALLGKPVNGMGKLDQPHTWTYAPDFGKALAIAGTHDEALGQAWHVPSGEPRTQRQVFDTISQQLGKPVQARAAGKFMMRVLGLFNKTLAEMPEMMYEFTQPFVLDSRKFQHAFGMQPTPFGQQIADTLTFARHFAEAHATRTQLAKA